MIQPRKFFSKMKRGIEISIKVKVLVQYVIRGESWLQAFGERRMTYLSNFHF